MTEERILRQHRQELQARGLPAYQLFEPLEGAGLGAEALAAARKAAAGLVEAIVAQGLAKDSAVLAAANALARSPDGQTRFSAWAGAVEAAQPWRPAVRLVLTRFGAWCERLPEPEARDAFLAALPRLGVCFTGPATLPWWARLGAIRQVERDMEEILAAAKSLPAASDCRRLMELLGGYGETTRDIVMGACRIGRAALGWKAPDHLDKLATIVEPKAWQGMGEGERYLRSDLLRDWGALCAACEPHGEEAWNLATKTVLLLADENLASAQWAAEGLGRALQQLPSELVLPYLRCANRLAAAIGIRAIGFARKQLPKLLARHGVAPTTAFVDAAADAGLAYGPTAGQWFLERKTAAARGLL